MIEVPVSGKALLQTIAFIVGGAISGGGVSYALGPSDDLREIRAEIKEEMSSQAEKIDRLSVRFAEFAAMVSRDRMAVGRLEDDIDALDARVRALEIEGK